MPYHGANADFAVLGGVTSSGGTESNLIATYDAGLDEYTEIDSAVEARSNALVRPFPNVCPGAPEEEIDEYFSSCQY